jgi:hypothetical protein
MIIFQVMSTNPRTNIHFCALERFPLFESLECGIKSSYVFLGITYCQVILEVKFLEKRPPLVEDNKAFHPTHFSLNSLAARFDASKND